MVGRGDLFARRGVLIRVSCWPVEFHQVHADLSLTWQINTDVFSDRELFSAQSLPEHNIQIPAVACDKAYLLLLK